MAKPGYVDQGFWFRLLFMLLYWAVLNIALTVFGVLVIIVSAIKLLSQYELQALSYWLKSVACFIRQTVSFLSYETQEKPFPFQPWPQVNEDE